MTYVTYLDLVPGSGAFEEGGNEAKIGAKELEGGVELLSVLFGPPVGRVSLHVIERRNLLASDASDGLTSLLLDLFHGVLAADHLGRHHKDWFAVVELVVWSVDCCSGGNIFRFLVGHACVFRYLGLGSAKCCLNSSLGF